MAGLTQERLKQQGAVAGIEWSEDDYIQPKDFENDAQLQKVWDKLAQIPLGSISATDIELESLEQSLIHRPHDMVIQPEYSNLLVRTVNDVDHGADGKLPRTIYEND